MESNILENHAALNLKVALAEYSTLTNEPTKPLFDLLFLLSRINTNQQTFVDSYDNGR